VDKPNKGNTITIKINGDNKTYQEELNKHEPKTGTPSVPKVVKMHPDIPDPRVLEETAAAQESIDESFDWIIPESSDEVLPHQKPLDSKSNKKQSSVKTLQLPGSSKHKPGRPLGSIFISAIFAVLIGTAIGIFMLKLVMTETGNKSAVEDTPAPALDTAGSGSNVAADSTNTQTVKALTTYVVQGGIYSTMASADAAAASLTTSGIPSKQIKMDGKYYIFLGSADSLANAKLVGQQFKTAGAEDAFAKQLMIDEKKLSGLNASEKRFVQTIPEIFQNLSSITANAITTNIISAESVKELSDVKKTLTVSGIKQAKVKDLNSELKQAEEKIASFQETNEAGDLNDAEQHLLNFLAVYYAM